MFPATTPAPPMRFAHERYLGTPSCPKCGVLVATAEASYYMGEGRIRHAWLCHDCDYGFVSEVKLAGPR